MAETGMKTRSVGLKKAYFGEVNPAGGMPTEMKQLAKTLQGTASFNNDADTTQDFYSEEEPFAPEESVVTTPGLKYIRLNFMEWDNNVLVALFGGEIAKSQKVTIEDKTYTIDIYKAPKETVQVEMAVRVISLYNVVIEIPRAKVTARFVWNLTRTEIAQIEVTATAQAPIGASDGTFHIYKLGDPDSTGG